MPLNYAKIRGVVKNQANLSQGGSIPLNYTLMDHVLFATFIFIRHHRPDASNGTLGVRFTASIRHKNISINKSAVKRITTAVSGERMQTVSLIIGLTIKVTTDETFQHRPNFNRPNDSRRNCAIVKVVYSLVMKVTV